MLINSAWYPSLLRASVQLWPTICNFFILVAVLFAAGHVIMTKQDERAAIGWLAVICLMPRFGFLAYVLLGVNKSPHIAPTRGMWNEKLGDSMKRKTAHCSMRCSRLNSSPHLLSLVDKVANHSMTSGNSVSLLRNGAEAYPAMLAAIEGAARSIALCTYIFDHDIIGAEFVDALHRAHRRGVLVRVLVDAVGVRYGWPSVVHYLRRAQIPACKKASTVMKKTDSQLKRDIEDELQANPQINAAQIGVVINRGIVSLLGEVNTYAEKWAAEDITKKVGGVRIIAEDLTVRLPNPQQHTDADIADFVLNALNWDVSIPKTVTATVHKGRVTLRGEVDWNYQREAAERAVRYLEGVVSVDDIISIRASAVAPGVVEQIRSALKRQAMDAAQSIEVSSLGGTITLSGKAGCWHDFASAADAAWTVPGVTKVIDNLTY